MTLNTPDPATTATTETGVQDGSPDGPARTVTVNEPRQLAALGHPVRARILTALETTPVSAQRLAENLGMTHGKIGHHMKVLERAGLIDVVETRKVRALTEKIYGPAYDRIRLDLGGGAREIQVFLQQIAANVADVDQPLAAHRRFYTKRVSRPAAAELAARLAAVADDIHDVPDDPSGSVVGVAVAVFDASP